MPDKGTLQDHLDDALAELARANRVIDNFTETAHRLHGEIEDYKAANTELRYQLELAREEARQAYKRADQYRAQLSALGERFSAVCATQADLMRQLEEAGRG